MEKHDDAFDSSTAPLRTSLFEGGSGTPGTTEGGPPSEDTGQASGSTDSWHRGLDFGLLVLRLMLGVAMGAHGLQKMFGLFDGPGIGGFADQLESFGYTGQTLLLSWLTALAEVGGGVLLILGLFTPLGAAAVLAVLVNTVYVKWGGGFFQGSGEGYEYELTLGVLALALLFTGSGRLGVDKNTPWRRKPVVPGIVFLVLAVAASTVVLVLTH